MTEPASPPRTPMERVAERLLVDPDSVGRAMVERIVQEVPTYARISSTILDDVSALAARNGRVMCQSLAAQSVPTRDDLSYVAEHVRRRVHSGVGLEPMIHAYRVGNGVFWSLCLAEAASQGMSRDACLALAEKAFEIADSMTTHAAETYVREEARARASSRDAARDLLEVLLSGDVTRISAEPHVAAPGLDPHDDLVVAVCALAEARDLPAGAFEATVSAVEQRLVVGQARPLVAVRQNEVVTVIDARRADRVADALLAARAEVLRSGLDLRAGISLQLAGFAGVRDGYRHAAAALSHTSAEHPAIVLDALPAIDCALLMANATTRSVITGKAAALAGLDPAARTTIERTVTAFAAADMNLTRAAVALHVHPNTLRYRFDRIRAITEQDPRSFAGLMELVCMLRALAHD